MHGRRGKEYPANRIPVIGGTGCGKLQNPQVSDQTSVVQIEENFQGSERTEWKKLLNFLNALFR